MYGGLPPVNVARATVLDRAFLLGGDPGSEAGRHLALAAFAAFDSQDQTTCGFVADLVCSWTLLPASADAVAIAALILGYS